MVEVDLPSLPTTEAEASGSELMNADGRHVTEVVTGVGPDDSRHAAAQLGVPRDDLVRIDTVISESGTPWIGSRHWVPASRFPGITDASMWEPPVYRMLREHYGVRLRYAWRTIEATSATAADARCSTSRRAAP
ncbi:hypothetical protein BJF78_32565 [Pseudonocardia sp. CNS-139]|nr:hypothetical protein BJF78_32565 [Pseudonocardia sp. CNS-139]